MPTENIELLISGKKFANWRDLEITRSLDTFSSVGFSAPFEPERKEFRDVFRPFSFQPIELLLDGKRLFRGTMIDVDPTTGAESKSVVVRCYAAPGVLCDNTAPTGEGYKGRRPKGAIKTEFKKLSLQAIAQQLCDPFDLDCEFLGDPGAKFDKVAIGVEEKIFDFLVPLAQQRGFVITNSIAGKVRFWKPIKRGVPVVQFYEGVAPLTTVRPKFSPQDYHSQITGYSPAKRGRPGGVRTVFNPWLGKLLESGGPIDEYRPLSVKFNDTERADALEATRAKLGRMFANMVSYDIEDLPTWRDPDGNLWEPNTSITLLAPGAMVYAESELLIREVKLKQTGDAVSASLNVVLAGSFSGEIPERLPWIVD